MAAINEPQANWILRAIDVAMEAAEVEKSRRGEVKLVATRHLKAIA